MPPIPYRISVRDHPGSSLEEIEGEPDWASGHQHRIGFFNGQDRKPGITHDGDYDDEQDEQDIMELESLENRVKKGDLINFRDVMKGGKARDWIKNTEEWPANVKKRRQQKEAAQKEAGQKKDNQDDVQQEHEWKRQQGENKHRDAYGVSSEDSHEDGGARIEERTECEKLQGKYSPQEIALLRSLQSEKDLVKSLKQNDGQKVSPMKDHNRTDISIDEADQFSPDNWIPRSSDLIRLTGKHPLNGEPHLTHLFEAGLVTPNELHYVRNHGAVPRLMWEYHQLEIEGRRLVLSMDDLKHKFDPINIQVALACDGNRRKELNMMKRSKGFNWGSGAVSCAFWKGPLLRDVLLAAGVPEQMYQGTTYKVQRYWVNFEGADEPSEGKYATSIPFQYAMDPTNDVILAYEMNNVPLPPDHGYPVRLIIPGYIGGRCVKWLKKIWISDKENDSYYHIWDNRVLPSFVTEKDGEFAETLFRHPDTACNEQNLNSVTVRPAHGEKIVLTEARKSKIYKIEGYAYDGGGHEVQRVEISLDAGKTWLYCIRTFPEYPIRHGTKFWTWVHWHIDIEITHLLRAESITVRCFNVFKNTQPEQASWNVMGMMNNCWYVVRPEIATDPDSGIPSIMFRHPTEPGNADGGWMKPSMENQIATAKQEAATPQKQFTREEIEKHDNKDDCWLVVDGKVYDATKVLSWHPGGKAAILGHAGKVHQETSDEFASIHDGYAYEQLRKCILGVVTDKAKVFIKRHAETRAKETANSSKGNDHIALRKHRWVPVKLKARKSISEDTRTYTFILPEGKNLLGLGTCQHVQVGFHLMDGMLIRSYTPTRPLLPPAKDDTKVPTKQDDKRSNGESPADAQRDGDGTFDLTVKTYFPDDNQPGGAMSNILDCMHIGEEVEIRGPTGDIVYHGNGTFMIEDKEETFKKVNLVLGGSGITPGYALIARVLLSTDDKTELRVVDANKTEEDILLHQALDAFEKKHGEQLKVTHVLSHPSETWKGKKGHVNADILKEALFAPGDGTAVFLCGPPSMIQKAVLPALRNLGFKEEKNVFGF
ncbi:hypothetical protein LTR50_001364 [Elasticomyces elasticus]|nr:hypothetical protein LTR50_001364 [Elasticomyces elasticus]